MAPHPNTRKILALSMMIAFFLAGCTESVQPLPPLLQNVSAGGGWGSACPPRDNKERKMMEGLKLAVSPELEQRLLDGFPPGSSSDQLASTLTAQGFQLRSPCEADQTIQSASFFRETITGFPGFLSRRNRTSATVYWKSDDKHRIVWTKGFVSYQ